MMSYRRRKSPRLQGYDYSQHGAYFVTVCVQYRQWLFGEIIDEHMRLSPAGQMIDRCWERIQKRFASVELDCSVVMPNHIHGIVVLQNDLKVSLPEVMHWFKTITTIEYTQGVSGNGWTSFEGKLWQRSYHDHIIRDEADLRRIQEYVLYNPRRWQDDRLREVER
jgi:putative transposase